MVDIVIGYFKKEVVFDEIEIAYRLKESFYGHDAKLNKGKDTAVRELKEKQEFLKLHF